MYRVTFYHRNGRYRSRNYKSENNAQRAIWKWLREKPDADNAVFTSPQSGTQVISDWRTLPVAESKQSDFYRSIAWLRLRVQAFEKYGNQCACCGATPADGTRLHVDHIKPRSTHPELALELDNLQILCEACNLGKSNLSKKQWR